MRLIAIWLMLVLACALSACASDSFVRTTQSPDGAKTETRVSSSRFSGKEAANVGSRFLDGISDVFGPNAIVGALGTLGIGGPATAGLALYLNRRAARRADESWDEAERKAKADAAAREAALLAALAGRNSGVLPGNAGNGVDVEAKA